jgi:hypothetical protein
MNNLRKVDWKELLQASNPQPAHTLTITLYSSPLITGDANRKSPRSKNIILKKMSIPNSKMNQSHISNIKSTLMNLHRSIRKDAPKTIVIFMLPASSG